MTDIVERLVDLHRKVLASPRVETENGPGAKVVMTYSKAAAIDEAACEIERLRAALDATRRSPSPASKAMGSLPVDNCPVEKSNYGENDGQTS